MERCWLKRRDWVGFAVISICCFLLFCHEDILITANHSYAFLQGRITDFYSACHEMTDLYSANYLPLTFLVFAIWNIPLKLLGLGPQSWGDWSLVYTYWNKLLPVLFFFASAMLVVRLCRDRFGMKQEKAQLIGFLFLTMPVGFFSQFLFCQYDILTVFCMLLGLWFYFSPDDKPTDHIFFLFLFGIAISFKYFAVLIFVVFLFLKEKRVPRILASICGVLIVPGVQFGLYYLADRAAFKKSVLGFKVFEYVELSSINIGFASIKLLMLGVCFVAAMAYLTQPQEKEELVRYGLYYSCGMVFMLFSLMKWHPQWLMFAIPFWTLGLGMNRNYRIFLWLELLFSVVFVTFTVIAFSFNVDQNLLKNGLLSYVLQFSSNIDMNAADLLKYKDRNALFTIMVVIMLVFFVYNRPRFHMKNVSEDLPGAIALGKAGLWIGILLFVIPTLSLLPKMLKQEEVLWRLGTFDNASVVREAVLTCDENVFQTVTLNGDEIRSVQIHTRYAGSAEKEQKLIMTIYDASSGKAIAKSRVRGKNINIDGMTTFEFEHCQIDAGKQYRLGLCAELGQSMPVSVLYGTGTEIGMDFPRIVQNVYQNDFIEVNGKRFDADRYHVVVEIDGLYKKPYYGIVRRSFRENLSEGHEKGEVQICFNGDALTGVFDESGDVGVPKGTGTFRQTADDDPVRITGSFEKGTLNGDVEAEYRNGSVTSGEMVDGFWNGVVTRKESDGTLCRMHYENGIRNGHVCYYDQEGQLFRQDWYCNGVLLSTLLSQEEERENSVKAVYAEPFRTIGSPMLISGRITDLVNDGKNIWIKLCDKEGLCAWYQVNGGSYSDTGNTVCRRLKIGDTTVFYGPYTGLGVFYADPQHEDYGKTFPIFQLVFGSHRTDLHDLFEVDSDRIPEKLFEENPWAAIGETKEFRGIVLSCEADTDAGRYYVYLEDGICRYKVRMRASGISRQNVEHIWYPGETVTFTGTVKGVAYQTDESEVFFQILLEPE